MKEGKFQLFLIKIYRPSYANFQYPAKEPTNLSSGLTIRMKFLEVPPCTATIPHVAYEQGWQSEREREKAKDVAY